MNKSNKSNRTGGSKLTPPKVSSKTRGAAIRAQRRNQDDANKIVSQHADASGKPYKRANVITDESEKLKVVFLGGLEDVGEKNMAVIE